MGLYLLLKRVGNVAYELDLPSSLGSILSVFHVFMLRKCVGKPSLIVSLESVIISLLYEEFPG